MAVSIPSDLIVDVMKAADPSRLKQATLSLSPDGEQGSPDKVGFPSMLASTQGTACVTIEPVSGVAAPQASDQTDATRQGFEQMVWRNLYETLLPDGQSGVFGGGPSAGIWRSMAADQLATVASQSSSLSLLGGLGGPSQSATEQVANGSSPSGWPYFSSAQIRGFVG